MLFHPGEEYLELHWGLRRQSDIFRQPIAGNSPSRIAKASFLNSRCIPSMTTGRAMTTEQGLRFGLVLSAYDLFSIPHSKTSVPSCFISPDGNWSESCVKAVVVSTHLESMVDNEGRILIESLLMLMPCFVHAYAGTMLIAWHRYLAGPSCPDKKLPGPSCLTWDRHDGLRSSTFKSLDADASGR